jgi:hypothetical protein
MKQFAPLFGLLFVICFPLLVISSVFIVATQWLCRQINEDSIFGNMNLWSPATSYLQGPAISSSRSDVTEEEIEALKKEVAERRKQEKSILG